MTGGSEQAVEVKGKKGAGKRKLKHASSNDHSELSASTRKSKKKESLSEADRSGKKLNLKVPRAASFVIRKQSPFLDVQTCDSLERNQASDHDTQDNTPNDNQSVAHKSVTKYKKHSKTLKK